ncbi:acyl-[acyl-carrier-protein]--UDP-N-acetylglucosamine O-acyltransferase [Faunimonas pinastri]|uniref:Acyl-[acyl-carrier-protein]--UDP-N-acetylglucosamine O-acyltransferase n=1 Tax=Faunimonas pinastri TaxID=1855383 RepID=A0A1H9J655_9HYPH|nr:acyl-ACP--UDP-N-acetylglucosamine O-acyltransferase [Faunimonas pinastri]SEQ82276.1 acyl-[acyl-carrier-protein]--UDP-N-acetylglucosamine O-acyltransferase [Faunimonas pinastri]
MNEIHSTAIVASGARIGEGVKIGPFCVVGENVSLGDGCELKSHVVVEGRTSVGDRTRIFPFASLGHQPQDLKYRGEESTLSIGSDCLIREGVTMNPGTTGGRMTTTIGNRCVFLTNSHVGHDCAVGDGVILSNNVMLAGHVSLGEAVIVGGGAAIIQFTRVGDHAFVGGMAGVENDVIPFGSVLGNRAYLGGLNLVGLKRRGFSRDAIHALRHAYRELFHLGEGTLKDRVEKVAAEYADQPDVQLIVAFLREGGERAVCTPRDRAEA